MKRNWKTDFYWVLLPLIVGALSGFLSRDGSVNYEMMVRPALSPPAIVFPVVWTALYILMGIGAMLVYRQAPGKMRYDALNLFIIQLVVNFFWSLIFFNAQAYGFAVFWLLLLLVLVVGMSISFYRVNKTSGLLQIPYILWLLFAFYLNYGVWKLNG